VPQTSHADHADDADHANHGEQAEHAVRLIAAPFTVFCEDGSPDLAAVESQAASLVRDGVTAAFVCGTTGEGASLTIAERIAVAKRWCEVAGSGLEVIVHVGHACLAEASLLATAAERAGASAIGAVPPYYYRPRTIAELVASCAEIAAAAPSTPFLYYHIPSFTGVCLPMPELLEAAPPRVPTFAGVKFTHEDLMEFRRCLEVAGDELSVHFGRDELLLPGLVLGARSAVGSTYNFAAPLYLRLAEDLRRGDLAAAEARQALCQEMVRIVGRFGGLPALKGTAEIFGLGPARCRPPLTSLEPAEVSLLEHELERIGFLAEVRSSSEWLHATSRSRRVADR
jgi:N-acetylneuraminate lyase